MKKKLTFTENKRLLRAVALIITVRDEAEEKGWLTYWCEEANKFLDIVASGNDEANKQFENVYTHIYNQIKIYAEPSHVIFELLAILKRDLERLNMPLHTEIAKATKAVNMTRTDVEMVKRLDSVTFKF